MIISGPGSILSLCSASLIFSRSVLFACSTASFEHEGGLIGERRMLVHVDVEFFLETVGKRLGARDVRIPAADDEPLLGHRPETGAERGQRIAGRHADHDRHFQAQLLDGAADQQGIVRERRDDEGVGPRGLDLVDVGGDVLAGGRIGDLLDDLVAALLQRLLGALGDRGSGPSRRPYT